MRSRFQFLKTDFVKILPVFLAGLISNCSQDSKALYDKAREKERAGQYKEAISFYKQALTISPQDIEINRNYQNLVQRHGDKKELIQEYRAKVDSNPLSSVYHYLYGRITEGEERIVNLKRAVELDRNFVLARRALVKVLFSSGLTADAFGHATLLTSSGLCEAEDWVDLAKIHHARNELFEEEKVLLIAKGKYKDARIPLQLGALYCSVEKYKEAKEELEDAMIKDPGLWKIYPIFIQVHHALGNFAEAGKLRFQVRTRCNEESIMKDFVIHIQKFDDLVFICRERFSGNVIYEAEYKKLDSVSVVSYKLEKQENIFALSKTRGTETKGVAGLKTDEYKDFIDTVFHDYKTAK